MPKLEFSHQVTISGEVFRLRSDQPPQVMERISAYLDLKLKDVGEPATPLDRFRAAVLTALNITGELFEAREALESEREKLDECRGRHAILEKKARSLAESLDRALI